MNDLILYGNGIIDIIMQVKLREIASTSSGVTFRNRLLPIIDAEWTVIQMKDLCGDNSVAFTEASRINGNYSSLATIQKGDLLFRSRGQVNTAALVEGEYEKVICAAPLIKIRPDLQRVIPEYLRWYINRTTAQNYLWSSQKGTAVKMISKQALDPNGNTSPSNGAARNNCRILPAFWARESIAKPTG
jgi:hypothetical protein